MPTAEPCEQQRDRDDSRAHANGRDSNLHKAIAARAYEQWQQQGQPEGTELTNWCEAETDLMQTYGDSIQAQRRVFAERAVSRFLAESAQFADAVSKILQAICESLDWSVGLFWILERDTDQLRCIGFWRVPTVDVSALEDASRSASLSVGAGLPGRVWAGRIPAWVPDVSQQDDFPRTAIAGEAGLNGAVAFPVLSGGLFLGVMEFFSREIREPDREILEMLHSIGSGIGVSIERQRAESVLQRQDHERLIARQIQEGLLPPVMPALVGFSIGGRSFPSEMLGGDYFDFFDMADDKLGIAIGDASGHGIGAALIIVETRAFVRALALTATDLGAVLSLTNRRLVEDLDSGRFVTLFLARLDPRTRSLVYAGAAHCPGFVLDGAGRTKAALISEGFPLGLDPLSNYSLSPALTLESGDLVFLYTDGIIEALAADESGLFGIERALSVVREYRRESPARILDTLFRTVADFSAPQGQADDFTAVILKVTGEQE